MIYKLNRRDFYMLGDAMAEVVNFPEAHAVIEGTNPGEVYVNNSKKPTSALVWNQGMQSYYFIGETKNEKFLKEIKAYVNDVILQDLKVKDINWFEVIGTDRQWEAIIEELFRDKGIKYEYQLVYRLNDNKEVKEKTKSKYELCIKKLTKDVLASNISNLDFLINELELFWGTMENFFDNGTCYYATENNKAVSICYTGFKAKRVDTIGIRTLNEYQKKGYAFELATRFIEDCISRNVSPYWDCSADNKGSRQLARKLGFDQVSEYKCFWFNF
jgi:hypothetical protein